MHALVVTVPILYQWQTEVRTTTSVRKPHPITEGLGGVVHEGETVLQPHTGSYVSEMWVFDLFPLRQLGISEFQTIEAEAKISAIDGSNTDIAQTRFTANFAN